MAKSGMKSNKSSGVRTSSSVSDPSGMKLQGYKGGGRVVTAKSSMSGYSNSGKK